MQATKASGVPFRVGGALVACLLAVTMLALVLASAASATPPKVTTYIGLGDSATFGYTQERFEANYPAETPSYFDEGFGTYFTKSLNRATEVGRTVTFVNDGCPNETSDGMIGHNLPGGGEGAEYNPCPYQAQGYPLHNPLGSSSQLENALGILNEGSPAHPVRAITLNVGMGDEAAAIKRCEEEFNGEVEAVKQCWSTTAPNVTQPLIIENIENIISTLDSTEPGGGHYTGPIILVGVYNPNTFVIAGSDQIQEGLNLALKEEVAPKFTNVTFADPFPVFNKGVAGSVAESKSVCKYTEMCNPSVQVFGGHPTGTDGDPSPSVVGAKALARLVNAAYLENPAR